MSRCCRRISRVGGMAGVLPESSKDPLDRTPFINQRLRGDQSVSLTSSGSLICTGASAILWVCRGASRMLLAKKSRSELPFPPRKQQGLLSFGLEFGLLKGSPCMPFLRLPQPNILANLAKACRQLTQTQNCTNIESTVRCKKKAFLVNSRPPCLLICP